MPYDWRNYGGYQPATGAWGTSWSGKRIRPGVPKKKGYVAPYGPGRVQQRKMPTWRSPSLSAPTTSAPTQYQPNVPRGGSAPRMTQWGEYQPRIPSGTAPPTTWQPQNVDFGSVVPDVGSFSADQSGRAMDWQVEAAKQYQRANNPYDTSRENFAWKNFQSMVAQPGLTPQEIQLMKNQAAAIATKGGMGVDEKIRSQMARSGLSGSGVEAKMIAEAQLANTAAQQKAQTDVALQNAMLANRNKMALAGMGIQGARSLGDLDLGRRRLDEQQLQYDQSLAERQRQFDEGTRADMYRFGAGLGAQAEEARYQRGLAELANQYRNQEMQRQYDQDVYGRYQDDLSRQYRDEQMRLGADQLNYGRQMAYDQSMYDRYRDTLGDQYRNEQMRMAADQMNYGRQQAFDQDQYRRYQDQLQRMYYDQQMRMAAGMR